MATVINKQNKSEQYLINFDNLNKPTDGVLPEWNMVAQRWNFDLEFSAGFINLTGIETLHDNENKIIKSINQQLTLFKDENISNKPNSLKVQKYHSFVR